MKWIWIALVAVACGTASNAQQYQRIGNEELVALQKKESLQIVDVRTPEEVSFGMIEGAAHIDFYDAEFVSKIKELDKQKPVVLYCAVGGRSARAMRKLQELGFSEVYDLKSGFRGWQQAGYPVKKP